MYGTAGYASLSASQRLSEAADTFPSGDEDRVLGSFGSSSRGRGDGGGGGRGGNEGDGSKAASTRHSRKISWDYSSEVETVLEDGTRVLADGTRINPDGSITLGLLEREERRGGGWRVGENSERVREECVSEKCVCVSE